MKSGLERMCFTGRTAKTATGDKVSIARVQYILLGFRGSWDDQIGPWWAV